MHRLDSGFLVTHAHPFDHEKLPGGSNFISKTITGNILWTTWKDVLISFLVFSAIGIVHFFFQKPFRAISKDPNHGDSLKQTRLYDMLFYMTFGIVIVKAIPVGGVFLIFILLITPAASITLFTQNWKKRLIGSWLIGITGSVLGIYLSYSLNISNGPAIVCLLGVLAIALTLLMGGILVYFGIHVIKREIVFIDIALAQIAALGEVVALIIWPHDHNAHGHEGDNHLIEYLFALLFTTLAAGLFSVMKNKKVKIPLEALIGISYAVATTAMVIILDKGAGSDVHIHDMLTGAILWVTWDQILRLGVIVFFVALFHFFARKQMIGLTDNYHSNTFNPAKKKLWDFLFYSSWKARILAGLLLSGLLTIPSHWLSWIWDVPASPVLIFFLGIALVIGGIIYRFRSKQDQK